MRVPGLQKGGAPWRREWGELGGEKQLLWLRPSVPELTLCSFQSLPLHGIWDRAGGRRGESQSVSAAQTQDTLVGGGVLEGGFWGGSLTLRCQHLTQQKMQSPVKSRRPATPPSTMAKRFGQALMSFGGETARENRCVQLTALCQGSGHSGGAREGLTAQ